MSREQKELWQDRPAAAFGGVDAASDCSTGRPPSARQFFTVDLRGLRQALAARAAAIGMTESDVLRGALAAALATPAAGEVASVGNRLRPARDLRPAGLHKLSIRLPDRSADRLDRQARAAGLSRGAYLSQLIEGAPPVVAATDRVAGASALKASSAEMALLSRDIHHLTALLRAGSSAAAQAYRATLDRLDADVRAHLDKAATTLAELSPPRRLATRLSSHVGRRRTTP